MQEFRNVSLKSSTSFIPTPFSTITVPFCNTFFVLLTLPFPYQSIPSCFFLFYSTVCRNGFGKHFHKIGSCWFSPPVLSITKAVPVTAYYISANTIFDYAMTQTRIWKSIVFLAVLFFVYVSDMELSYTVLSELSRMQWFSTMGIFNGWDVHLPSDLTCHSNFQLKC